MTFNISIKADSAQAEKNVEKLHADLAAVEAAGPRAGKAVATGMRDSEVAAKQLQKGLGDVAAQATALGKTNPFSGLTAAIEREHAMLEKIHGPAKQMQQDLETLASLHRRGAISAKEYDEHLKNIEKRKGPAHDEGAIEGSFGKALAGKGGDVGELGLGLTKGKLAAGAVVGLGAELVHLGDEYTHLQQSALRLTPSMNAVNGTIEQQLSLSRDLHTSLEQAMELSIMMKERTEDLIMSERQRDQIEHALGEAAILSGRSAGQAAEAYGRLTFAYNEGLPVGREMKSLLRDFPPLADAVAKSLNVTTRQLMDMAKNGRLSLEDLNRGVAKSHSELKEKAEQVPETLTQQLGHAGDWLNVHAGGAVEAAGSALFSESDFAASVSGMKKFREETKGAREEFERLQERINAPVEGLLQNIRTMKKEIGEAFRDPLHGVDAFVASLLGVEKRFVGLGGNMKEVTSGFGALGGIASRYLNLGGDSWQVGDQDPSSLRTSQAFAQSAGEARKELAALNAAFKAGGVPVDTYRDKQRALQTTIEGGMSVFRRLYYEIADGTRTFKESIAALDALYKKHTIGRDEYAMRRSETLANSPSAKISAFKLDQEKKAYEAERNAYEKSLSTGFERDEIEENKRIAETLSILTGDVEKYRDRVNELAVAHAAGKISAEQYGDALAIVKQARTDARDKQIGGGVGTALDNFEAMQKPATDRLAKAQQIQSQWLEPFNKAVIEATETGKFKFEDMGKAMLKSLEEVLLKMIEIKIITAALGGGEAAGAGGALSGLVKGLGFAHGGDFDVPRAANGLSGTVGGYGGTDSKLAMFRVTPGEHVSIRTPQQVRDAASSNAPAQPHIVNVHNHYDRSEMLAALDTRDGVTAVHNIIKSNPAAIRSYLGL